ncbi:GM20160 [Drosophila sechellia]|uniref:GM20160 n=1 Tax=Drosophila sechellia TaxID=7238 RepID=B4HRT2_DROSE|nr:GM20160 [Drosophila sechellia]
MPYTWLVLLSICFIGHMTDCQLVYKLNKVECQVNQARVKNVSCNVKPINWNTALVNMDCYLISPLINPTVRVQVFMKDYSNQYKPFLIDAAFKLCEVVERKNFLPYGVIVWELFQRFTNAKSCYLSLRARNGYLNTSYVPPFPHGQYQISVMFTDSNSTNREFVAIVKFFVQSMDQIKSKKRP